MLFIIIIFFYTELIGLGVVNYFYQALYLLFRKLRLVNDMVRFIYYLGLNIGFVNDGLFIIAIFVNISLFILIKVLSICKFGGI